ncbi:MULTISPECIES: hypothetical protein [unclassified Streptomyces]|uniref:hypothetical protein n=1 Tax=unclassified Streptomyces TaxID=2593676 RepID=UPI0033EE5493
MSRIAELELEPPGTDTPPPLLLEPLPSVSLWLPEPPLELELLPELEEPPQLPPPEPRAPVRATRTTPKTATART